MKLGDIAKIGAGQGAPQGAHWFSREGYPFIRARSLDALCADGHYGSLERVTASAAAQYRLRLYPPDTIIFPKSGMSATKNRVFKLTEPAYVVNHLATLEPSPAVCSTFFRYWLESFNPSRLIKDPAYPSISQEDIEEVEIDLPPLNEQKRIVARLSRAEDLRRTSRHALQMCEELLPATFLEMFSKPADAWPMATIEELAERKRNAIRTGPFGSQLLHSEFTANGIAVLGIDNAVNDRFEWDRRRYISSEKYRQLERYTVFPGDVIITIMGTCGRCAVVPQTIPLAINTKHLCCITVNRQKTLPTFLHAAFLYHPGIRHQLGVAEKGAIMEGLNMEIIKELRLPLPPMSLQEQFANLAEKHERLRATDVEALRQADHLFETLLHQAFTAQ